jgi:hypothetical protein
MMMKWSLTSLNFVRYVLNTYWMKARTQMSWTYKGAEVPDSVTEYYGFVYVITNETNGRKYIGRKYFTKAGYKTVKGKRKKIRVSSGWEQYYGSNKALLEDVKTLGEHNFTREIIRLCRNRSECSYWETHYIFTLGALLSTDWYNEWVTCKISKKNILPDKPAG